MEGWRDGEMERGGDGGRCLLFKLLSGLVSIRLFVCLHHLHIIRENNNNLNKDFEGCIYSFTYVCLYYSVYFLHFTSQC